MKNPIIVIITSICSTILWILGLISGNFLIFIISLIVLVLTILIAIKNFDEIEEFFSKKDGIKITDERTKLINEKASTATIGITVAILLYGAIGILTLRNVYPNLVPTAYFLIAIFIIILIINLIAKQYYKHKY